MNDFSGWDKLLDGKIAVVTVAARGIGRAAAIALAQSGAQIAGIDICAVVDRRSGDPRIWSSDGAVRGRSHHRDFIDPRTAWDKVRRQLLARFVTKRAR